MEIRKFYSLVPSLIFNAYRKFLWYRSSPMRLPRSTRRANSFLSATCLSTCNESTSSSLPSIPWVRTTFPYPLQTISSSPRSICITITGALSLSSSYVEGVAIIHASSSPTHEQGVVSRVRIQLCFERLVKEASTPLTDDFVSSHFLHFMSLYPRHFFRNCLS